MFGNNIDRHDDNVYACVCQSALGWGGTFPGAASTLPRANLGMCSVH